jgi:hypothetical protein
MVKQPLYLIAIGTAVVFGGAIEAAAGGCCTPIYVVNQGPVRSGPGPFISQLPEPAPKPYPGAYPYVGFVFSGYPYGYHDAWIGAPYADAMDYRLVRRYSRRGPRIIQIPRLK